MFGKWWAPEEFKMPIESEEEETRKEGLLGMKRNATVVGNSVDSNRHSLP